MSMFDQILTHSRPPPGSSSRPVGGGGEEDGDSDEEEQEEEGVCACGGWASELASCSSAHIEDQYPAPPEVGANCTLFEFSGRRQRDTAAALEAASS